MFFFEKCRFSNLFNTIYLKQGFNLPYMKGDLKIIVKHCAKKFGNIHANLDNLLEFLYNPTNFKKYTRFLFNFSYGYSQTSFFFKLITS